MRLSFEYYGFDGYNENHQIIKDFEYQDWIKSVREFNRLYIYWEGFNFIMNFRNIFIDNELI